MTTDEDREWTLEEYADGLIALGEFVKTHPDVFQHKRYDGSYEPDAPDEYLTIRVYASDATDLGVKARALGNGEKFSRSHEIFSSTGIEATFGPHVIEVFTQSSAVCTPKRTESRMVPVLELTDEAKAEIEAIKQRHTRMESRPVVTEWDCPPSLLALADDGTAA